MSRRWQVVTVLALVLTGTGISSMSIATEPAAGMEQMIQGAQTKADHEALAAKYEAAAKELLAQAKEHESMAASYAAMEIGTKAGPKFSRHCERLAGNLRSAAQENQDLATLHREFGAQSGK